MILPLLFGIGHPGQLRQKPLGRVDHPQVQLERAPEQRFHLGGLVRAQQAVVHEDAR
jgi:hypothetical protein